MKPGSLLAIALVAGGVAFASAQQAHSPQKPTHAGAQASGLAPVEALLFEASSAPSKVSFTGTVQVRAARQPLGGGFGLPHRTPRPEPDAAPRTARHRVLSGDSVVDSGDVSFAIDAKRHRIVETRNDAADDATALNANFTLLRENYRDRANGRRDVRRTPHDRRDADQQADETLDHARAHR